MCYFNLIIGWRMQGWLKGQSHILKIAIMVPRRRLSRAIAATFWPRGRRALRARRPRGPNVKKTQKKKNMCLGISSGKWRPFCLGMDTLNAPVLLRIGQCQSTTHHNKAEVECWLSGMTGSVRKQMIWLYMVIPSHQDDYVNGCYANVIVDYV